MCAVVRAGIGWREWDERAAFENSDLLFGRIELVLTVTEQIDTALVLFERLFKRQGACLHLPDDGLQFRHGGFKGFGHGCRFGHGAKGRKPETIGKKSAKKQSLLSRYAKISKRASIEASIMTFFLVFLSLFVVLIVWGVIIYNGLVALANHMRNTFAQIDVQLQRRYDLIPNLVDTAKAYMKHERETLEAVIAARNQAMQAAKQAKDSLSPEAMRSLQGAEGALGGLMTRFFALAEAYPDLKANQNMAQLQEELTSTENRISFARQAFNDAVMRYNIKREVFPDSLVASRFGFLAAQAWKSEEGDAIRKNFKVSF